MITANENPLKPDYWLGNVSPEPLALFRIGLGLTLLHDAWNFFPNVRVFLSDEGMLPRALLTPMAWSVFEWVGSPVAVSAVFALGVFAVLAFTLGFHARVATVLSFIFVCSLHHRNPFLDDGGDDLIRNLLFLSIFADLGGCYSADVRSGRRARGNVPVLGLRFLQAHLALLYFVAARLKFRAGWATHNVLYRCLQLTGFLRPPGVLLARFPALCYALGLLTLVFEWVFAFLALSPVAVSVTRALAIAASLAVQLGILATMKVGVFTETMIISSFLFVPAHWIQALEARIRARLQHAPPARSGSDAAASLGSWRVLLERPAQAALLAFLSFNFLMLAWPPFAGRRFPLPAWLTSQRRLFALDQPFGLFDHVYPEPHWSVRGTLQDGTTVDVLPATVPELAPSVGWNASRWYKFTFVAQDHPFPYRGLASYLCSEYRANTGRSLKSITLGETLLVAHYPDQAPIPTTQADLWAQSCAPAL